MALSCYALKTLITAIEQIIPGNGTCKVLSLGYPDILITKEQLKNLIENKKISRIKKRNDCVDVSAMHKMESLANWCCESYSLFEALDCQLEVIDFVSWSGKEKIVDLNYPVTTDWHEQYDLIIDPGTTEHIFNISEAMMNILKMVKVGGFIYHSTPFNFTNHGFYNFSPTFYIDFYEENSAKLISCNLDQDECNAADISLNLRETFKLPQGTNSSVLVQKKSPLTETRYPTQGKYKSNATNQQALEKINKKYQNMKRIALIPYNSHSKFFNSFFTDKETTFFDDNPILNKYLGIEPISKIDEDEFDIILINSITFEKRIREKLLSMGISSQKILLQI